MLLGIGGSGNTNIKIKDLLDQDQVKLVSGMRKNISQLNEDANVMEASFTELLIFLREQKSLLAATPSIWPVRGWVTSGFGPRRSPFGSGVEFHGAIDIATRMGKEVISPADGFVVETTNQAASDGSSARTGYPCPSGATGSGHRTDFEATKARKGRRREARLPGIGRWRIGRSRRQTVGKSD